MPNSRPWTEDDDATVRRMARAGRTDVEIAAALGRDRQCIGRRRRDLGVETGYNPSWGFMMMRVRKRYKNCSKRLTLA